MHTNTSWGTAPCIRGVCLLVSDWRNEANHPSSVMVVLFNLQSPSPPRLPRIMDGRTGPRRDEVLQLPWIAILRDFAVQERGWTCWKPRWFCGRAAMSGPVWTKAGVRPSAGCARKNTFLHVASGTAAKRSPGNERNPFCPPFQGQALWLRGNVETDNGLKDSQKAQPPPPLPRPHPYAGWGYEEGKQSISNPSAINFSPNTAHLYSITCFYPSR